MKKLIILVLLVSSMHAFGQSAAFGIKGGLNFGATGDITSITNESFDGDNEVGFHLGAFARLKFAGIFIQPELVYTRLTTDYGKSSIDGSADYKFSKIDIPVLLGIDIVGPLSIKAGPAFQLVLNNDLDVNGSDVVNDPENTFTIGYQIGVGVQLGRLGLDLRYENAFSENDTTITSDLTEAANNQQFAAIDSRPSQWILSLSYQLKGSNKK
ncbi:porin family protein [Dokdonia sp.]|uniref:porin family protein n=1 Tax=Dokdonia sp. TaxID=2024995 RepID=UPI003266CDE4